MNKFEIQMLISWLRFKIRSCPNRKNIDDEVISYQRLFEYVNFIKEL